MFFKIIVIFVRKPLMRKYVCFPSCPVFLSA